MAKSPVVWKLDPVLFGVIAALLLLHVFNLPPWIAPVIILSIVWRGLHDWRNLALPNRLLTILLMTAGLVAIFLGFGNVLGRDAGTALLTVAASLKLLETRQPRDAYTLLLLGFFLIITHFLFSQTPLMFLLMLGAMVGLVSAWIGLTAGTAPPLPRQRLRSAIGIIAAGLPATIILFLLVPRPPGGLWGVQQPTTSGVTGLSETMRPGELSELALSDEVAFRVNFEGPIPPNRDLYWRGPVMWHYDGLSWSRRAQSDRRAPPVEAAISEPLSYTVTLEPHGKPWLFALDIPLQTPPRSRINSSLEMRSVVPVESRLRYRMRSATEYILDPYQLSHQDRLEATALPPGSNPRLRALAEQWRAEEPAVVIERALSYFSSEPFSYTLSPGLLPAKDGMDTFLFESRAGYCEHYASAFVLLMRAAGIPARVVTGYQGGEINNDYLIVRQSDAHAWAEVWLEGKGWIRVDPTAVIAPERIETGIADSIREAAGLSSIIRREKSWRRDLALKLDRLENKWNQWVLGYSATEQSRLLEKLGMEQISRFGMLLIAIGGAALTWLLVFWLIRLWPATRPSDPVEAAWLSFQQAMRKEGLPRHNGEAPRDYQRRIADNRPELADLSELIIDRYVKLAYGPARTRQMVQQLQEAISTFRHERWVARWRRLLRLSR